MIVLLTKKPSPFLFETLEDILEARDVKIIIFKVGNIAKRLALIWKDVFFDGTSRTQDSWVEEMTKYVPILKHDLKDRLEVWNESPNSSSEVTTPKSTH